MAYTKNPARYPATFHAMVADLRDDIFTPTILTYPTAAKAKNARQLLLAYRAALHHKANLNPDTIHAENYNLSLALTTRLTTAPNGQTTLTISTCRMAWDEGITAETQPLAGSSQTPSPEPAPQTDAEYAADFAIKERAYQTEQLFTAIKSTIIQFKQIIPPASIIHSTADPQSMIDYCFETHPSWKPSDDMRALATALTLRLTAPPTADDDNYGTHPDDITGGY